MKINSKPILIIGTVAALTVIALLILQDQQERQYGDQATPHKSFLEQREKGAVEVMGFAQWCQEHKRPQEDVKDCVERFQGQVKREKLWREQERIIHQKCRDTGGALEVINLCIDQAICDQVRKVKPHQRETCLAQLKTQRTSQPQGSDAAKVTP